MSKAEDDDPNLGPGPGPGPNLMDLDLDLDPSSWPFDPISAFVSSPIPSFILSSSPPSHSLPHFPFPPPPSPLWLFDDRAADLEFPPPAQGNSDATNGAIKMDEGWVKLLHLPSCEGSFDNSCAIKERMTLALRFFKESTDQHVLVQVWAPMKKGERYVLTTTGQPFVLDPQSTRLLQYRMASLSYMFSLDEDSEEDIGLPGRVFKQKLPEWTPNVQYYSSKEYPRLDHALRYDVQGSLALPVFEHSGQACVGVVELIMTAPKIHYAPEVDKVCKALEAANLKSSEILDHPNVQICNEGRQAALAEILEILTVVCEAHKLPLAQTWVPCRHGSVLTHGGGLRKSCSSFDGSCMEQVSMSTTDVAFYVIDPHMWGFRDACVEHHLQKGQGVAGRAFESFSACFCADVSRFCKTKYPLVHYARMFGLASCLAICLQSTESGNDNYILEFFLPPECKGSREQQALVDSISSLMKQCARSLKVMNSGGLQEGESLKIINVLANEDHKLKPNPEVHGPTSPEINNPQGSAVPDFQEKHVEPAPDAGKDGHDRSNSPIFGGKNDVMHQRRRGKAEKSISLQVLQQYFAGSLKDAAKSLGVCPTTMKRICRQHGISRWPSRKINKVNRSLSKLKRVLESVRGTEGTLNLTSLTGPIPVAVVGPTQSKVSPREKEEKDQLSKLMLQKNSDSSKTRSSSEASLETPSQDSCQGSPAHEIHIPEQLLGGMLIEDSGSSKDLRNLCEDDPATVPARKPTEETRTLTIKACYKEDIIRFRIPCTAGMGTLSDEVAKRLKLEEGTFEVKYMDDDLELVVLACDADFEECIEMSRLSGAHVIRLTVHDIVANLGSSCESCGG